MKKQRHRFLLINKRKGKLCCVSANFCECVVSGWNKRKMSGSVKDVKSKAELDNITKSGEAVIIHFWASWCDASKQMDQVFSHLSTDFPNTHFLTVCNVNFFVFMFVGFCFCLNW
jgi:thiol-disulfide isomerase/thioredoxin